MNGKIVAIGGTLLGFAAGAIAGYFVATKRLEEKYLEIATKEIEDAHAHYSALYKRDRGDESPTSALERRHPGSTLTEIDKVVAESGRKDPRPDPELLLRVKKGLTNYGTPVNTTPDEETIATVKKSRMQPYVIPEAEFMEADDDDYTQISLIYYAGDDVLADEADIPLEDVETCVGVENLDKFGVLSNDKRVVYIRNDKMRNMYEIVKHDGTYQEAVGLQPEKQKTRPRKMRPE